MTLDKSEIKNFLPHREPFLFVDKVNSSKPGKSIEAELRLDPGLPFFAGHFPGRPIMPGVLITEALAQTAGLIIALDAKQNEDGTTPKIFYLASANIKYRTPVSAGETLTLAAELVKDFQGLAQFKVEAFSNRNPVASGTLVLAAEENVAK